MKKILGAIALCAISYSIGKYSNTANLQSAIPSVIPAIGGEVEYRIEFTGKAGAKLSGNYAIGEITTDLNQLAANLKKPTQVERVEGVLPKTVSFKGTKNTIVNASGFSYPDKTTVRIYRNGVECGRPLIVGSAANEGSKICDP